MRQSYARVGKFALIQHQRYAHAKQFKRANRMLKKLRTYLGRVIRDIGRKIEGNGGLEAAFAKLLLLAHRVREQQQRQRGPKVYSLHAPEVECIGKGKAHRPYEFGVKVSVATTLKHCKGGQFVTHVKALPGNPYDGHTLETVIPDMEALVGSTIARILADKGYRGHNAPPDYKFRVFLSGQKRGVTPAIKRELRRRSAVEPVIGHLKAEHRMGRNYLWLPRRRRQQRRPRRRRLQLPPPDPLAQDFVAPNPQPLSSRSRRSIQPEINLLHGRLKTVHIRKCLESGRTRARTCEPLIKSPQSSDLHSEATDCRTAEASSFPRSRFRVHIDEAEAKPRESHEYDIQHAQA